MTNARQFVQNFALVNTPLLNDYGHQSLTLTCRYCNKQYKKKTALRKHEAKMHGHFDPNFNVPKDTSPSDQTHTSEDHILNYTKQALTLGHLYMDQSDSIRMGDGERVIRINQVLCMYYKLCNCPKYAHGILETIVQSKVLLTERLAERLIWNRTVNHIGDINSNFPNDLDVEHCNRIFKDEAHSYRGVFTERTLNRVSRSAQKIDNVVKNFDKISNVTKPSGKHKAANFENDIYSLVRQYSGMHLFDFIPGRHHSAYQHIKENPLNDLDMDKVKDWIESCLKKFKQKHLLSQLLVNCTIFLVKCLIRIA